jgi:hypothetical protein
MIQLQDLINFQKYGNLKKLIDNYLEQKISQENNVEKYNLLVEVYSEGWGDTVSNWYGKIGDFLGSTKTNFQKAKDNFWQNYDKHVSPNNVEIAKRAYQMLEKTGLLKDENLKKYLLDSIENMKEKSSPEAQSKEGPDGTRSQQLDWGQKRYAAAERHGPAMLRRNYKPGRLQSSRYR